MDDRYRDTLQRHHDLLKTHIVLTDDVIEQMAQEKILPETMIKDVQDGDSREERNERLLNALRLRGNKYFKLFRELMYRTGHFFVADLLWEEEEGKSMIDEKDLYRKFPELLGCVQEGQKKKLLNYLDSKVREKALQLSWKDSPQDRMRTLNGKVIDFNQERGLRDTIATQERKIKDLESTIQGREDDRLSLTVEISGLQKQVSALKRDHRTTLDCQSRFHDANLTTIVKLKNRLSQCKTTIAELNGLMKSQLEGEASKTDMEDEEDDVRLPVLQRNVQNMLQQLQHEQEQSRRANKQREDVLKLLNRGYTKEPLVIIVKEVLKHEQKHRALVMRDILRLTDTIKKVTQVTPASNSNGSSDESQVGDGPSSTVTIDPAALDTKHFKNQLAMLRAEAEHIQKRFQWKDSEIASLRQEVISLKQRLVDYKFISPQSSSGPTPQAPAPVQTLCSSCRKPLTASSQTHRPQDITTTKPPNKKKVSSTPTAALPAQSRSGRRGTSDRGNNTLKAERLVTYYEKPGDPGSRRSSVGRADLDQMQVNAEQYLKEDNDEDEQEEEEEGGEEGEEGDEEEEGEEEEEEEEGENEGEEEEAEGENEGEEEEGEEEGEDEEEEEEEGEGDDEADEDEEEDEKEETEDEEEEKKTTSHKGAGSSRKGKGGGGGGRPSQSNHSASYQSHARKKGNQR